MRAPIKPRKNKLGKKIDNLNRITRKPLGVVMILGGLLLLGWIAQVTGAERAPWVWEDFTKTQGQLVGSYHRYGTRYLTLRTSDNRILSVAVDPSVTFPHLPPSGALVEVAYTDPKKPRIVRAEDLRRIWTPDHRPEFEGHPTQYGR